MDNVPNEFQFQWNEQRSRAAILLAEGRTQVDVASELQVTDRAIRKWLAEPEFSAEVDRLSLMMGIASRAERLRIAMKVARQKVKEDGSITTDKDILDWLKFAQSETDGIKLDLPAALATALAANGTSLAAIGSGSSSSEPDETIN